VYIYVVILDCSNNLQLLTGGEKMGEGANLQGKVVSASPEAEQESNF